MVNDEQLELDEVAGDFCDWFAERIHHISVRQSNEHYLFMRMCSAIMLNHFNDDIEQFFGRRKSSYNQNECG